MQPSLKIELNACVVSIFLRQNKERINNVFDSDFYCSVFDLTFFFSGYLPSCCSIRPPLVLCIVLYLCGLYRGQTNTLLCHIFCVAMSVGYTRTVT